MQSACWLTIAGYTHTAQIASGSSAWTWDGVPYPLPFAPSGLYEVEVRPASWNISADSINAPVLVRSTYFNIGEGVGSAGSDQVSIDIRGRDGAGASVAGWI